LIYIFCKEKEGVVNRKEFVDMCYDFILMQPGADTVDGWMDGWIVVTEQLTRL